MSGSYHFISWRRRHVREVPKAAIQALGATRAKNRPFPEAINGKGQGYCPKGI